MVSSFDIEEYFPPPQEARRFPRLLSGEFGLFETEARGTGLVKPMLLIPPPFPPDETVMVTGEDDGEEAVFTIFLSSFPLNFWQEKENLSEKVRENALGNERSKQMNTRE